MKVEKNSRIEYFGVAFCLTNQELHRLVIT